MTGVGDFGIKHGADLLIEFLGRLYPRFLPVFSQYRRQNILKWGCMRGRENLSRGGMNGRGGP